MCVTSSGMVNNHLVWLIPVGEIGRLYRMPYQRYFVRKAYKVLINTLKKGFSNFSSEQIKNYLCSPRFTKMQNALIWTTSSTVAYLRTEWIDYAHIPYHVHFIRNMLSMKIGFNNSTKLSSRVEDRTRDILNILTSKKVIQQRCVRLVNGVSLPL